MHPQLTHQMMLERTARFQRDAEQFRQAREAHIRPPRLVRTAIKLRLSTCRHEFERFVGRGGATGRLTE